MTARFPSRSPPTLSTGTARRGGYNLCDGPQSLRAAPRAIDNLGMEPNPYESPRESGYEPLDRGDPMLPADYWLIVVVGMASLYWILWALGAYLTAGIRG
jgi:hypothetical protein